MSYRRIETTDGKTVMNKALYDNLQDGIEQFCVTPEMFGAVGDGVNDDTQAVKDAFHNDFGKPVFLHGTYLVKEPLNCSFPIFGHAHEIYGHNSRLAFDFTNVELPEFDEFSNDTKVFGLTSHDSIIGVRFRFVGLPSNYDQQYSFFLVSSDSYSNLKSCYFSDAPRGLYIHSSYENSFEDLYFENMTGTILSLDNSSHNTIKGVVIKDSSYTCLLDIFYSNGNDISFTGSILTKTQFNEQFNISYSIGNSISVHFNVSNVNYLQTVVPAIPKVGGNKFKVYLSGHIIEPITEKLSLKDCCEPTTEPNIEAGSSKYIKFTEEFINSSIDIRVKLPTPACQARFLTSRMNQRGDLAHYIANVHSYNDIGAVQILNNSDQPISIEDVMVVRSYILF